MNTNTAPSAPVITAPAMAIVYDTETTKLPMWTDPSDHPGQPHMVQLAAKLINLKTREVLKAMDVLVKPDGWVIPDDVIAIHGITNERAAAEGIPEAEAVDQFLALVAEAGADVLLIGHNITFDKRIVRIGIKRYVDPRTPDAEVAESDKFKAHKSFCTMWKARPHTKLPKLTEAYQHFTGKTMKGAHSAGGDVDGCIAVYFAIANLASPTLKIT